MSSKSLRSTDNAEIKLASKRRRLRCRDARRWCMSDKGVRGEATGTGLKRVKGREGAHGSVGCTIPVHSTIRNTACAYIFMLHTRAIIQRSCDVVVHVQVGRLPAPLSLLQLHPQRFRVYASLTPFRNLSLLRRGLGIVRNTLNRSGPSFLIYSTLSRKIRRTRRLKLHQWRESITMGGDTERCRQVSSGMG